MRIVPLILLTLAADQSSAGPPNRRNFFGWLGGGTVALTAPSPIGVPAPSAPRTLSLDTVTRARARQLRSGDSRWGLYNVIEEGELRRRKTAATPMATRRWLQAYDRDVLRDWSLMSDEGRRVSRQVARWIELSKLRDEEQALDDLAGVSFENLPAGALRDARVGRRKAADDLLRARDDEMERLARLIDANLTEQPWATLDWFEVFGTRLAMAEMDVHFRTQLELFDAQKLISLLLDSVTPGRHHQSSFLDRLIHNDETLKDYNAANVHAVIESIATFAPDLAASLGNFHLNFDKRKKQREDLREAVGSRADYNFASARDDHPNRPLLRSRIMNSFIRYDLPLNCGASGVVGDIRRRAESLDQTLARNLSETLRLLRVVETLGESPLKTALLRAFRSAVRETEFERATLPNRLHARSILAVWYDATREDPDLAPRLMELMAEIPAPESRAWAHWRPSPAMIKFPGPEKHPARVEQLAQAADLGVHFELWAVGWLKNLLDQRVALPDELVTWMPAPPEPEPLQLEHQPDEVVCPDALTKIPEAVDA